MFLIFPFRCHSQPRIRTYIQFNYTRVLSSQNTLLEPVFGKEEVCCCLLSFLTNKEVNYKQPPPPIRGPPPHNVQRKSGGGGEEEGRKKLSHPPLGVGGGKFSLRCWCCKVEEGEVLANVPGAKGGKVLTYLLRD